LFLAIHSNLTHTDTEYVVSDENETHGQNEHSDSGESLDSFFFRPRRQLVVIDDSDSLPAADRKNIVLLLLLFFFVRDAARYYLSRQLCLFIITNCFIYS